MKKYNLNIQKLVQQFLLLFLAIGVGWFVFDFSVPFYQEHGRMAIGGKFTAHQHFS